MKICILICLVVVLPTAVGKNQMYHNSTRRDIEHTAIQPGTFSVALQDKLRESLTELSPSSREDADVRKALQDCLNDDGCKGRLDGRVTELQKITSGLEIIASFTSGLTSIINGKSFKGIATLVGQIAPFFAAAGALVSFISLFGETEEIQRLKLLKKSVSEGFKHVDGKFDSLQVGISRLELLILKKDFWRNIHSDLEKLRSGVKVVQYFFDSEDDNVRESRFNNLRSECRLKDVMSSINAVYDAFTGKHRTETFCNAVIAYSNGDAKEVVGVSTHLINAVVLAAQRLLILMQALERSPEDIIQKEKEMVKLVDDMIKRGEDCEKRIRDKIWKEQWKKDVDTCLLGFERGNEEPLAVKIYNELTDKYSWRLWLVAVTAKKGNPAHTLIRDNNDDFKYIKSNNYYRVYVVNMDEHAIKPKITEEDVKVATNTRTTGFLGLFWPVVYHDEDRVFQDLRTKSKNKDMKIIGVVLDGDGTPGTKRVKFACRAPDSRCETAVHANEGGNKYNAKWYRVFLLF